MRSDDSEKNLRVGLPEISRIQISSSSPYYFLSVRGHKMWVSSFPPRAAAYMYVTPERCVHLSSAGADPMQHFFAFTIGPAMLLTWCATQAFEVE